MNDDTKIELLKIIAMIIILALLILGIAWMNRTSLLKEQNENSVNNTVEIEEHDSEEINEEENENQSSQEETENDKEKEQEQEDEDNQEE